MHRLIALTASLFLAASSARADDAWSGDMKRTAAAESLFQEARTAMLDGDYAKACPLLEEVTRLEPRAPGAKVKLAECYEGAGKLASAFAMYSVAASFARDANQPDRAEWALDRATVLGEKVSRLTIRVGDANASIPGLTIERDGDLVGRAQWGVAIPVDGGPIGVTAKAPGFHPITLRVEIAAQGDRAELVVPALIPEVAAGTPDPPPASTPEKTPPAPDTPAPDAPQDGVPVWVWIVGSTGLATGLVGVAFRIDAAVVEGEQSDACGQALAACPRTFDVEGSNARKELDFGLFVGLGVTGAVGVAVAIVGGIVDATTSSRAVTITTWREPTSDATLAGLRVELE